MPSCVAEANPVTVLQAVACEYALQPDVWEGAEMQAIIAEVLYQLSRVGLPGRGRDGEAPVDHFVKLLGYGKAHSLHAIEVRRGGHALPGHAACLGTVVCVAAALPAVA
jgi:hypothetical protein